MAFFEQIGKRITDVGQGAAQQAKNLADITRLSGMVSEKEKRITQLYGEIGKRYYERHRDDPEAEEFNQVREIAALSGEIAKCKESIKQLRGITRCPECGADVAPGATICGACGADIPLGAVGASEKMRRCPRCHKPVPDDNLFSNFCGTKIER